MSQFLDQEVEQRFRKAADKLTSLTGLSELLLMGSYGPLSADQLRIMEDVVQQARDLCKLMRLPPPTSLR